MTKAIRLFAFLLLVLTIFATTIHNADAARFHCICNNDPCTCFIQLGDEGRAVKEIITKLIEKGYLNKSTKTGIFTNEVEAAVMLFQSDNYLEITGMMDDDTLTLLLQDSLPSNTNDDYVYIPTDGGKKRHLNPKCSGMYDPRIVAVDNAKIMQFDKCKRCNNGLEAK